MRDNNKKEHLERTNPLTGSLVFISLKPIDLTNFTKEYVENLLKNFLTISEKLSVIFKL